MSLLLFTACLAVSAIPSRPLPNFYSGGIVSGVGSVPVPIPTISLPTIILPTIILPTLSTQQPIPSLSPITPVPTGIPTLSTAGPLTPVPSIQPTPGITPPPTGIPTALPTIPLIDPRVQSGPLTKFGNEYEDVVINISETDNNINFPREKRQTTQCGCYTPQQCSPTGNTDGTGLIDFRIVGGGPATCATGMRYCCLGNSSNQISCGSRLTNVNAYPLQPGQARYGDYPWMVTIMLTNNSYIGGGILIDTQNVLTTAHRISPYPNGVGLKIRLGEWDLSGIYEQYAFRDFAISRVWVHESFNPNTLQNDVALIRLTGGVPAGTPGIVPVCMPTAGQNFEGQRCWVAGWGKDAFGTAGNYQNVLKTVDVSIIAPTTCETTLRTTRLGTAYLLDRASFICAGGEVNKDSCTGDGGSGLVCEVSTGRWVLAGLVAWGLGCATQGVPAAYVNVVNYLPWVQARESQPA